MVKYCHRRGGWIPPPPKKKKKITKLPFLGKLFRFRGGGVRTPGERLQDHWSSGFHYVLLDGIFHRYSVRPLHTQKRSEVTKCIGVQVSQLIKRAANLA